MEKSTTLSYRRRFARWKVDVPTKRIARRSVGRPVTSAAYFIKPPIAEDVSFRIYRRSPWSVDWTPTAARQSPWWRHWCEFDQRPLQEIKPTLLALLAGDCRCANGCVDSHWWWSVARKVSFRSWDELVSARWMSRKAPNHCSYHYVLGDSQPLVMV